MRIFTLLLPPLLAAPAARAACSREALLQTVDEYLLGLSMGQAGPLQNIADDFFYQQNNRSTNIVSGVLGNILRIEHNRTLVDADACATYTEVVSATSYRPWVVGMQIRHRPHDHSVYLMDAVVATAGSSETFNATETLRYAQQEDWSVIKPPARRDSREALKAAADAYLDMWSDETAVDAVPWGTPCDLLDGSLYTPCEAGIPADGGAHPPASSRRYVIDETLGAVNVMSVLGHLGGDGVAVADSHEFRLEGGKLRYVHAITIVNPGPPLPPGPENGYGR